MLYFKEEVDNTCAYCESPSEGNYSIHRDDFGEGPEVPLCDVCGGSEIPTLNDIWARISQKGNFDDE